jgi:hypothetical protein
VLLVAAQACTLLHHVCTARKLFHTFYSQKAHPSRMGQQQLWLGTMLSSTVYRKPWRSL